MRRVSAALVAVMWGLVLLGGPFRPRQAGAEAGTQPRPQIGYAAPPIAGVDWAGLKGKAVYLNFWASWCAPCRLEMPEVQRLSEHLPPDTALITVSVDTASDETVRAFLKEHGYTFPVVHAPDAGDTYRVLSLPTSLFISPAGVVTARVNGPLTYGAMLDYLNAAGR